MNSRILVRHIGERHFGIATDRPEIAEREVLGYLLAEATSAPELWHQKAYLARVVSVSPDDGIRDEGILPLTHFLDSGGHDGVAMTVEADGSGAIYPVVYTRAGGTIEEHTLEPHPLLDFETSAHRDQLASILGRVLPSFRSR